MLSEAPGRVTTCPGTGQVVTTPGEVATCMIGHCDALNVLCTCIIIIQVYY